MTRRTRWPNRFTYAAAVLSALWGSWYVWQGNLAGVGWLVAALWLFVVPSLTALAASAGYDKARADMWARASEAQRRRLTIIEWVESELERDGASVRLIPPEH